jgi:heat shock protein HslJ
MQQGEEVMKKYLSIPFALLVVLSLLLSACQPAATSTPEAAADESATDETTETTLPLVTSGETSIQGILWQWVSVTDNISGAVTTVTSPENYTIVFNPDGTFEGKADCNNISGSYSQEGGGFTITLGPSTMAYCGETSLDQQYLSLLGSVAAGGPDGQGNLALETAGGAQRMLFQNGGAPASTAETTSEFTLQGVEWQWISLTDQTTSGVTTVGYPENYTIVFNADGTLYGKADCNNFNGTYTQDGGIVISIAGVTRAYCGDTSLDQQYLSTLGSIVAGGPDGLGNLALETAGGAQRMVFQNGGAPEAATSPEPTFTFQDVEWQWVSLTNQNTGKVTSVPDPAAYLITFYSNGTLSGRADCNTFSGNYTLSGSQIDITIGAMSRAYCGEASLDQKFLELLGSVASGGPADDQGNLALYNGNGMKVMLFQNGEQATGQTEEFTLQGIVWQWTSVTDKSTGQTTTVPTPEVYTLVFNADGTLYGKADCNSFQGAYTLDSGGIDITLGPATLAYCGETSLDQQFLMLVDAVVAGGPDGQGNLALETAGGAQRLVFRNGGAASQ